MPGFCKGRGGFETHQPETGGDLCKVLNSALTKWGANEIYEEGYTLTHILACNTQPTSKL